MAANQPTADIETASCNGIVAEGPSDSLRPSAHHSTFRLFTRLMRKNTQIPIVSRHEKLRREVPEASTLVAVGAHDGVQVL